MEVKYGSGGIFPGITTYSWFNQSDEVYGGIITLNYNGIIKEYAYNLWYDYSTIENGYMLHKNFYLNKGASYNWYRSGQMRGRMKLIDKDGVFLGLGWYENGQLKSKTHYLNKNYHGLSQEWYENGQLKTECIYENGSIKVGSYKKYNEDGSEAVDE